MSLVRLLTTGKSLIGIKDSTSRYQMRHRHLLPKFGAERNPFAAPAASTPARVLASKSPAAASPGPAASVRGMSPAEAAAARLKETKRLPTAGPAEAKPATRKPSVLALARGWFSRWLQELTRRHRQLPRNPAPKSAISRSGRPPVQDELSLDQIKVVRNDLSEADVEIVPARPEAKARSRPVAAAGRVELAETQTT